MLFRDVVLDMPDQFQDACDPPVNVRVPHTALHDHLQNCIMRGQILLAFVPTALLIHPFQRQRGIGIVKFDAD